MPDYLTSNAFFVFALRTAVTTFFLISCGFHFVVIRATSLQTELTGDESEKEEDKLQKALSPINLDRLI